MNKSELKRIFNEVQRKQEIKKLPVKKVINSLLSVIEQIKEIDENIALEIASIDYLKDNKFISPTEKSKDIYNYERDYGLLKIYDRDYMIDFASDTEIILLDNVINKFNEEPRKLSDLFTDNEDAYTFDLSDKNSVNELKDALISTIAKCNFKDNLVPKVKKDNTIGKPTRDGVKKFSIDRNLKS